MNERRRTSATPRFPTLALLLFLPLALPACGQDTVRGPDTHRPSESLVRTTCTERPRAPADATRRGRAPVAPRLNTSPMVVTPRAHPALGFPTHGSIAVGTVTHGYLVDAAQLPLAGENHRVLQVQSERRTNFGADETIGLILEAAAAVARRHPGAILYVGNIAKGGGGDIPWSVSHNSGLDADLSFYWRDERGEPAVPNDLFHADADLNCVERPGWTLDVERTWDLIAALVDSDRAALQWLFIANPIRDAVLTHARRSGAPPDTIRQAAEVLRQPRGALPHDDHIHVRLFCPADDLLDGCRNRAPERTWMPSADVASRRAAVRARLAAKKPEARAAALRMATLLGDRSAADRIVRLLSDDAPEVRTAALAAATALDIRAATKPLAKRLPTETSPETRHATLAALADLGGPTARDALLAALADERPAHRAGPFARRPVPVRTLAAYHLGRAERRDVVGPLLDALESESGRDPAFRPALRAALRHLTNRAFPDLSGTDLERRWRRWWKKNRRRPRARWLAAGFRAADHKVPSLDKRGVRGLLGAVAAPQPWLTWNARRALSRLSGRHPGSERWSRADATQYWTRWCSRRWGWSACR